jgi:hypothetical protein
MRGKRKSGRDCEMGISDSLPLRERDMWSGGEKMLNFITR